MIYRPPAKYPIDAKVYVGHRIGIIEAIAIDNTKTPPKISYLIKGIGNKLHNEEDIKSYYDT